MSETGKLVVLDVFIVAEPPPGTHEIEREKTRV